uniref:Uncharacterized protein n=1 Tax=Glossina palpalis gambiensis TaxID=67801 RepID=A0A1B0C2R0_9MUSC
MSLKLLYLFCAEVILFVCVSAITDKHPDGVETDLAPTKQPKELIVEYSWVRGFPLDEDTSKIRQSFLYWMQQANTVFNWLRKLDNEEPDEQPPSIFVQGRNLGHFCSKDGQKAESLEQARAASKPRQIVCWLKDFLDKNYHNNNQIPDHPLDYKIDANTVGDPKAEIKHDTTRPLTIGKAKKILKYLKEFLKGNEKSKNINPNVDVNHQNQDISRGLGQSGVSGTRQPEHSHNDVPQIVNKRIPVTYDMTRQHANSDDHFVPKYIEPANKLLYWLEGLVNEKKKPDPLIPRAYKHAPEGMKADSLYRNDHRTDHYNDEEDKARHVIDQLNNFSRQDRTPPVVDDLNNLSKKERVLSRVGTLSSLFRQDKTPHVMDESNIFSRQDRTPHVIDGSSSLPIHDRTPHVTDPSHSFSRQDRTPHLIEDSNSFLRQDRTPHVIDESNSSSRQERTFPTVDKSNSVSRHDTAPLVINESNSLPRPNRTPLLIEDSNSFLRHDRTPHLIDESNSLSKQERTFPTVDKSNSLSRHDRTPHLIEDSNSLLRHDRTPHVIDEPNSLLRPDRTPHLIDDSSSFLREDRTPHIIDESNSLSRQERTFPTVDKSNSLSRHDRTPHVIDESNSFSTPDGTSHIIDESNSFLRKKKTSRIIDESNGSSRQERTAIVDKTNSHTRHHSPPHVIDEPNNLLRQDATPHLIDKSNSFSQNSYEQSPMDSQSDYVSSDPYEEEMPIQDNMLANNLAELNKQRTYNEFVDDRFFAHLDHANKILFWLKKLIAQSKKMETIDKVGGSTYPSAILDRIKKAIRELETLKKHLLSSYN